MFCWEGEVGLIVRIVKTPASIRDVAARSGYSKSTVSLVFRGDPSIPKETADKIWRAARELDYRPNPLVVSLVSTLRARKSRSAGPVIAYLTSYPSRTGWKRNRTFERHFVGARTRCSELGYRLEHFWFREPGMTSRRLEQVFAARNIHGIVLGPVPTGTLIELDWQRFALAKIGFSLSSLPIHAASNHQLRTINVSLEKLVAAGKRRIGFLLPSEDDIRVDCNWSAGRLLYERGIAAADRVPVFDKSPTRKAMLRWYYEHSPDAIVTTRMEIFRWLREAEVKIPEETSVIDLDADPRGEISGMDQRSEAVGAAAVDLVVEQLNYNQRGLPSHPRTVLTEGVWIERGTTSGTCARPDLLLK